MVDGISYLSVVAFLLTLQLVDNEIIISMIILIINNDNSNVIL